MSRRRIRLTDVSLTDGQGAVWAGAMTTPMVGAVVQQLAAAQPDAIEVCSPDMLRQCVLRGEDPWQRIDVIRQRCPGMALRAVVSPLNEHGVRGADMISRDVAVQWLRELARRGVREVLLIDPLLDMRRLGPLLKQAAAIGITPIAALPLDEDSILGDATLCGQAAALAAAGAARVQLRDAAGLMTPGRLATLLPALRQVLAATPLDFHLGCQTALAPLVALEAVQMGIDGLDTALAPLANGASVVSFGTLVKSLRLLGFGEAVDGIHLPAIDAASDFLVAMAERHDFPAARPWAFSLAPYIHRLPGEVAALFMARLDALDRWNDLITFAEECARIRGELGRPPMLAPFARAIADQAWRHLQGGPRYVELIPGVRRIIQQCWGPTSGRVDAGLARRVGGLPASRPASLQDLRARFPGTRDAALVLAQVCGVPPRSLPGPASGEALVYAAQTPADALISGLARRAASFAQLNVSAPGFVAHLCGGQDSRHV